MYVTTNDSRALSIVFKCAKTFPFSSFFHSYLWLWMRVLTHHIKQEMRNFFLVYPNKNVIRFRNEFWLQQARRLKYSQFKAFIFGNKHEKKTQIKCWLPLISDISKCVLIISSQAFVWYYWNCRYFCSLFSAAFIFVYLFYRRPRSI